MEWKQIKLTVLPHVSRISGLKKKKKVKTKNSANTDSKAAWQIDIYKDNKNCDCASGAQSHSHIRRWGFITINFHCITLAVSP